jgi:hypothetical protein
MPPELSLVKVDPRHHRIIAQENWGLTKEQMKGRHVHHRIKRCDGGTNDPSNLYVCTEEYHDKVWHAGGGGFAGMASLGSSRGSSKGGKAASKIIHAKKDERGRSLHSLRICEKIHLEKDKLGRSILGIENAKRLHSEKDDCGKSVNALKAHKEKDERGRSVHAMNTFVLVHEEKDEMGRSVHAMNTFVRVHDEKDEHGRSVQGVKNGKTTSSQKWQSTDPNYPAHISSPGPLSNWQKARGIDTSMRIKLEG